MPALDLGSQQALAALCVQLHAAPHGGKSALLAQAQGLLMCSRQQLYRQLAAYGYPKARKPRSDKGRSAVSTESLQQVAGLLAFGRRANGKQIMGFDDACNLAHANGLLNTRVSNARMSSLLKQHCLHPNQLAAPTPHQPLASKHPNHVWQLDASVCVLFYLKTGGLAVMPEAVFNKNKPKNFTKIEDKRITRYVITDHCSGTLLVNYCLGVETAENLITSFMRALQKRPNDPFHGVPWILMDDKGSANISHLFKNLVDRLGISHIPHESGNPRAKGQVENSQNIVERKFESRLRHYQVLGLDDLNAKASQWALAFNAKAIHSRTGKSRYAVWLQITATQLRIAPSVALCQELVTSLPKDATVRGDLSISHSSSVYGKNSYDLRYVPGVYVGAKVRVVVNPYRAPCVDVECANPETGELLWHTVQPLAQGDWGFRADAAVIGEEIKRLPDTVVDRQRKALQQQAFGVDADSEVAVAKKSGAVPYAHLDAFADLTQVTIPHYVNKRGTDLPITVAAHAGVLLSPVQAAKRLRETMGDSWLPAHLAQLKAQYPQGVSERLLPELLAQFTGPETPQTHYTRPALRVVGGSRG